MKLRLGIGFLFLVLSALMIFWSIRAGYGLDSGDVFLNVGTELAGIVITVAIVDWLLERQRRRAECKTIAWRALHELDYAVWVWQGGAREFDVAELDWLLEHAAEDDPLPHFTQFFSSTITAGRIMGKYSYAR